MAKVSIKIYAAQRTTSKHPIEPEVKDRKPTTRVKINIIGNRVTETPLPKGFNPDHIQVSTKLELKDRVNPIAEKSGYVDRIKVSDVNGNRIYPSSEIGLGLGVTDVTHINRMEKRLKELTYKDTEENVYTEGTDYVVLNKEESALIRRSLKSIDKLNNENTLTSENKLQPVTGNEGNVDTHNITMWSQIATMKIATSANTLKGEKFTWEVYSNYLETGERNLDLIEDIVEKNNREALPIMVVPKGMSRVSDKVNHLSSSVTRGECCTIGRVAKSMSNLTNNDIGKATSTFSNSVVNTYKDEILEEAIKSTLGRKLEDN